MVIGVIIAIVSLIVLGCIFLSNLIENGKDELAKLDVKVNQMLSDEGVTNDVYWTDGNILLGKTAISINEKESNVIILHVPDTNKSISTVIPKLVKVKFEDIIEVKINSNSTIITSTSRGSQVGGALVGGALFGGVGAIIGGLSGSTKSTESIKQLALEIIVDSIANPIITIPFYKSEISELKPNTPKYEKITKEINEWYGKFTVILHRQDKIVG
ncbi:MAG TPA: hypothetical protein VNR61_19210 [Niallia sp.]|nr:hypothetical protein [Niallia sp.]